jgi:autotransporter-associated beta strand protein
MQITKLLKHGGLGAAILTLGLIHAQAQTTATWTGATGGEWNTAGNWDIGVPGVGTNALINVARTINYNLPMTAESILGLTNLSGTLNVNTNGLMLTASGNAAVLFYNSARAFINAGGVMGVTNGGMILTTNSWLTVNAGGSFSTKNTLAVGQFGNNSSGGGAGFFTNNAGIISLGGIAVNNGSGNQTCLAVINGGTNDLGAVLVQRSAAGSAPALGAEGLIINSGLVRTTSIDVGGGSGNSWLSMYFKDGVLTNTGNFTVRFGNTASRFSRFVQAAGILVSTNTSVHLRGQTSANNGFVIYSVLGGTNLVGGFVLADPGDLHHSVFLTNSAKIYIGAGGISMGGGSLDATNVVLTASGTFGALTDWTNSVPMIITGGAIDAADLDGNARNITFTAPIRGSGGLTKTGNGTLTLTAPNVYAGNTTISTGILALATDADLGTSGSLASSLITVAAGATLDVSQVTGGYTLLSGKTVAGLGTIVGLTAGSGSHISPAGTSAQGTLKFTSGLNLNAASLDMELTDNPNGLSKTNDLIQVTGDLNLSGVTTISVTPVGSLAAGTYKIITFTGSLVGDASNFTCAAGTVVVNSGEIDLVVSATRPTANLVWRGDGSANLWDSGVSSNWLNGVNYDRFYTGDTNRFDDSATNFIVNIAGTVTPASSSVVLINATNDYTLADGGAGVIHGPTGLTKTNSGTLTITATGNDYTGVTSIKGGVLALSTIANGGLASPIGAASSGPANLVIDGGTLEYRGNSSPTTDRGITLGTNGATLSVTNAIRTLTLSGTLTGSGSLTKNGNGQITLTGANDYQGGTLVKSGILRANPASTLGTNILTLSGTEFSPATFQFAGDAQTLNNSLNVVGTNNFIANGGNDTLGRVTGNGTVYLNGNSGNLLTMQAIDSTAFTGTFYLNTLPTIRIFPASGTTLNASNATFNLGVGSGGINNRDGGTYSLGALDGGPSTTLRGSANSGSAATTYTIGGKGVDSTFAGVISTGAGGTGARVHIVKTGTGKLTFTGANTYNGFTTVSNGVLALGDGITDGSIDNTTNITIAAGAVLDVSGRSDGTLQSGGSQTLQGRGTIRGSLNLNGGRLLPGDTAAVGTLTVTNIVNLGGTVRLKLNRASSPNSDRLASSTAGIINYGGTLIVTNTGGALQAGDTFTLFSATTLNGGTFGDVQLPSYYTWDTSNLGVNGTIQVTAVLPLPALTNVDFSTLSSGTITLNAVNGVPNGPVIVQTTTNLLSNWTTVTTTTFDGSGNLNLPVTVNPATPQNYFRLLAN